MRTDDSAARTRAGNEPPWSSQSSSAIRIDAIASEPSSRGRGSSGAGLPSRGAAFLAAHPGDGAGSRYCWADTGLDAGLVREEVSAYQARYGVPDEPLK